MSISRSSSNELLRTEQVVPAGLLFLYFLSLIVPTFKALPLTPNEGFYVYLWFAIAIVVTPKAIFCKEIFPIFFLLPLHLVYIALGNYDNFGLKNRTLLEVFFMYAFPISAFVFFFRSFHFDYVAFFSKALLFFLVITSITTLVALFRHPEASRALAGNDNPEEVLLLLSMNIGSYAFVYTLALVAPLMIYFYNIRRSVTWLVLFSLFTLVVFYAQFTAALILFLVNVTLTLCIVFGMRFYQYLLTLFIIGTGVIFLSEFFVHLLDFVSYALSDFESVHQKLNEVILSLEGKDIRGTSLDAYQVRYELSLASFLKSPLIGGNPGGGHHYWMDMLALYGIAGLLPIVIMFNLFVKRVNRYPIFVAKEKTLMVHLTIMFIAIGINKNIIVAMPVILFVICPLLIAGFGTFANGIQSQQLIFSETIRSHKVV